MSSIAAPPPVTLGVEVELAITERGHPVGEFSQFPGQVISYLARTYRHLGAPRDGFFLPAGLAYCEMRRFLECASWPSATLAGALRQEEAILELARRGCEATGRRPGASSCACYPDDQGGLPARRVGRGGAKHSASMGNHVNLYVRAMTDAGRAMFVTLVSLFPEIVGPGGFIRTAEGGLEFWRDPRTAHVVRVSSNAAHNLGRPILKEAMPPERIQIVGLGWTASRIDRIIKFGLLMLLGAAAADGKRLPEIEVVDPPRTLAAPPGKLIRYRRRGLRGQATRAGLLEMLLDELLEPELDTPEGQAVEAGEAVRWARIALDAVRRPDPVALRLPASWALKQNAFGQAARAAGVRFPLHGETASCSEPKEVAFLEKLATAAILEANILNDGVRKYLLGAVPGEPWAFDLVYGQDEDVAAAIDEQRPAAGAARAAHVFMEAVGGGAPRRRPRPPPTDDPHLLLGIEWNELNATIPAGEPRVDDFVPPPRAMRAS